MNAERFLCSAHARKLKTIEIGIAPIGSKCEMESCRKPALVKYRIVSESVFV